MELMRNDYFALETEETMLYITVAKKGFTLLEMNKILAKYPRIALTKFKDLKEAIVEVTGSRIQVGEMKPELEWKLTPDKMSVSIRIQCTEEDLRNDYSRFVTEILAGLHTQNIHEGILMSIIQNDLKPLTDIIIANGIEPVNGEDAVIAYYKRSERKPSIADDGKVDYFDMNFLDEVKKGDWLGEKTSATEGKPGKTTLGDYVLPKKGKDKNMLYDKKTVGAFHENGKIVLRALLDGVVEWQNGKIMIGTHLIIDGDVGIKTGNIDFDGCITIKGTIMDHYSVVATKDISILSEFGIRAIDRIVSKNGDVFIKGGIFGKGKSKVLAKKNIYVKHANECNLEAGGNIHIGYYSLGSHLKGNHILTDVKRGKLIGGVIEAKGKVRAAIIGNRMERKTIISVAGFDRKKIQQELNNVLILYKTAIQKLDVWKQRLEKFEGNQENLDPMQQFQYDRVRLEYDEVVIDLFTADNHRLTLMEMLEVRGDGEISIGQMAFPDTCLIIKNHQKQLNSMTKGTFYAENNYLHFE